jgi:hypothetical protein
MLTLVILIVVTGFDAGVWKTKQLHGRLDGEYPFGAVKAWLNVHIPFVPFPFALAPFAIE